MPSFRKWCREDGTHVVWNRILGPQRGCYFLVMHQELSGSQALDWDVVNEVVLVGDMQTRARTTRAN